MTEKTAFALLFANRAFFPGSLIAQARKEIIKAVDDAGFSCICLDENSTRCGAVEGVREGEIYSGFLKKNEEKYQGVIISMPNFGDETGILTALKYCSVPILIQAFEDETGKMGIKSRRDAFCGKIALMASMRQCGMKFTTYQPHVLSPTDERFINHLKDFAAVCRVAKGLKNINVGAIGARTTPFKSVRFDEVTLQKFGINVETMDLLSVYNKVEELENSPEALSMLKNLEEYSDFTSVPEEKRPVFAKILLVINRIIEEYGLDALSIRCWDEFEKRLGIAPCILLAYLNQNMMAAACELDVCNAVVMRALNLASGEPSACFDWNNNYKKENEKCILFHCGCTPNSMLKGKSRVGCHLLLEKENGTENCFGVSLGDMESFDFTYASMKSEGGEIYLYTGEGNLTEERVDDNFFGVYGVASIANLQEILAYIGQNGYRHHVCIAKGKVSHVLEEAFKKYLGYNCISF